MGPQAVNAREILKERSVKWNHPQAAFFFRAGTTICFGSKARPDFFADASSLARIASAPGVSTSAPSQSLQCLRNLHDQYQTSSAFWRSKLLQAICTLRLLWR